MKKEFLTVSAAVLLAVTACNNDTSNTAKSDSVVNTTTTEAATPMTNTTTYRLENRKLVSLGSSKPITLRYDTVHYYYVDANTNEQPMGYYYDPETKDTFDYRGYHVNNALVYRNGDYTLDETRLMDDEYNTEARNYTSKSADGTKVKVNENAYKEKTDSSKIKITDRKTKVKVKNPE